MESLWLMVAVLLPSLTLLDGQRAPCYECEDYKEQHPLSSPYNQVRSHCSYPCRCAGAAASCPAGVSVVRDGCGCCPLCARQAGQPCDGIRLCDEAKGLICHFAADAKAATGVCKAIKGRPCTVYNQTYDNGETFMLDCRTQCACKNGTYACASLCPQENISPRGSSCRHPRLVEVPGQCCREWMCDSETAQQPPECRAQFSPWSACSAACGLGLSRRVSYLTPDCRPRNETRLCQLRSCRPSAPPPPRRKAHHVRKGHECKATQRLGGPVHLVFGECRSRRRYRPRACGECGGCCGPELSTTVRVEFLCRGDSGLEDVEPGSDLWRAAEEHSPHLNGRKSPWHSNGGEDPPMFGKRESPPTGQYGWKNHVLNSGEELTGSGKRETNEVEELLPDSYYWKKPVLGSGDELTSSERGEAEFYKRNEGEDFPLPPRLDRDSPLPPVDPPLPLPSSPPPPRLDHDDTLLPIDNALSPDNPPLSRLLLPTPPPHQPFPAKHVLSVDVEWVLKCQCSAQCLSQTVTSPPTRGLLHRVHRTAPP